MSNLSKKNGSIYKENEYHFVLECKQFDSLRKKYIPDIVYSSPTYSKFIFFLQNKNTDILKNLALYISEAYVLRDKILKNY